MRNKIKCILSHLTCIFSEYIAKHIRRNEHAKMFAYNRNDSTNVESIYHCETVYNKHSLRDVNAHGGRNGSGGEGVGQEVQGGIPGNPRKRHGGIILVGENGENSQRHRDKEDAWRLEWYRHRQGEER